MPPAGGSRRGARLRGNGDRGTCLTEGEVLFRQRRVIFFMPFRRRAQGTQNSGRRRDLIFLSSKVLVPLWAKRKRFVGSPLIIFAKVAWRLLLRNSCPDGQTLTCCHLRTPTERPLVFRSIACCHRASPRGEADEVLVQEISFGVRNDKRSVLLYKKLRRSQKSYL